MYMAGEYISRDINKSIHYYKQASSFSNQHAKNDLSILYRHGKEVKRNLWYPIELLKESIKQSDDEVAKYNLSHLYLCEENIKYEYDDMIEMLIESITQDFSPSKYLFIIALKSKQVNIKYENIETEIKKHAKGDNTTQLIKEIYDIFITKINNKYEKYFEEYRSIDFVYNVHWKPVLWKEIDND